MNELCCTLRYNSLLAISEQFFNVKHTFLVSFKLQLRLAGKPISNYKYDDNDSGTKSGKAVNMNPATAYFFLRHVHTLNLEGGIAAIKSNEIQKDLQL